LPGRRERHAGRPGGGCGTGRESECPKRLGDVLESPRPEVGEGGGKLAGDGVPNRGGHHDAPRLGNALQAGRDIDRRAEQVAMPVDDIAEMNADAERESAALAGGLQLLLERERAAHRLDGTPELREHAVAGGVGDAAAMPRDLLLRQGADSGERAQGTCLVGLHELRVADDIARHDRGQAMVRLSLVLHRETRSG
jgi:hypothetical protein